MRTILPAFALLACVASVSAEPQLVGELAQLEPIVGVWQVEAEWSDGTPLWAVAEWKPVLEGAWLQAETYVREPGADGTESLYHRYTTLVGWDPAEQAYTAWGFAVGGDVTNVPMAVTETDGRLGLSSEFAMGAMSVRDATAINEDGDLDWEVWVKSPGQEDWSRVMDGEWTRADRDTLDKAVAEVGTPDLTGAAESLAPFVGTWEISADWAMGGHLDATEINTPIIGGNFLMSEIIASDDGGPRYNRYRTVWAPAADGSATLYTFQHTGGVVVAPVTTEQRDGQTVYVVANTDEATPFDLKQELYFKADDAFNWKVMSRPKGGDSWNTMMDGDWNRVPDQ